MTASHLTAPHLRATRRPPVQRAAQGADPRDMLLDVFVDGGWRPDLVSVAVGLQPEYLRDYLAGWPPTLPGWVRTRLADHLGVSEEKLRGGGAL